MNFSLYVLDIKKNVTFTIWFHWKCILKKKKEKKSLELYAMIWLKDLKSINYRLMMKKRMVYLFLFIIFYSRFKDSKDQLYVVRSNLILLIQIFGTFFIGY